MGVTFLTREVTDAIVNISFQLEKANELKERELKIREEELLVKKLDL